MLVFSPDFKSGFQFKSHDLWGFGVKCKMGWSLAENLELISPLLCSADSTCLGVTASTRVQRSVLSWGTWWTTGVTGTAWRIVSMIGPCCPFGRLAGATQRDLVQTEWTNATCLNLVLRSDLYKFIVSLCEKSTLNLPFFWQAQLKAFGHRTDLDVAVTKGNGGATTVPAKCLPACEDQSMGNFQGKYSLNNFTRSSFKIGTLIFVVLRMQLMVIGVAKMLVTGCRGREVSTKAENHWFSGDYDI